MGHGLPKILEESVGHAVVLGRYHHVQRFGADLTVQTPPPVVHDISDRHDVQGVRGEGQQRGGRVTEDEEPIDGLDPTPQFPGRLDRPAR